MTNETESLSSDNDEGGTGEFRVFFRQKATNMPHVDIYDPGLTIENGKPDGRFVEVCVLRSEDGTDIPTLGDVYHFMQVRNWSREGRYGAYTQRLGLDHDSLSIGDLVEEVKTHRFYQLSISGFVEVSVEGSETQDGRPVTTEAAAALIGEDK